MVWYFIEHNSVLNRSSYHRHTVSEVWENMPIKVTINGKLAVPAEVKGELERSVLDAIVGEIKDRIRSVLNLKELRQITLHVVGSDLKG